MRPGGIHRQEGVSSLWRGLGPNVARNAIVNAAELASYDQVGSVLSHCLTLLMLCTFQVVSIMHATSEMQNC